MANIQAQLSTNLWDKALKALDPKDFQHISAFQYDQKKVLDEVLKEAQAKRDSALRERWRFKKKDGSVIILRDVFEKVVHWVSKYAQAVDVVANADPIHVGLPWAVVRFLLQTSTSDVQAFGYLSEGIEVVAGVLTRCGILERLYLYPSSAAASDETMHLSQCMVKVYINLLVYLANAKKFWSENTAKRMAKALFDGIEAKHHTLQLAISKADEEAHQAASFVQYQKLIGESDATRKLLINLLKDIREPLLRTAQNISDIHDQLHQEKRREILHWLSTVPCGSHHQEARKKLLKGTGTWLLNHPTLVEWQSSSVSAFFWLHGIPGAGKSSLTSFLIQTLFEQHKVAATQPPPLAFFYCSSKGADAKRSSPEEVLLAILRQLTGRDSKLSLRGSVAEEFRRRKEEADEVGAKISRLDMDRIVTHILDITADNPAIIIVDALDEVDDAERGNLLDALEKLVHQSQNLTKIFVSSRNDEDIVDKLKDYSNVCIDECLNREDIENFVKYKIEQAIKTQKLLRGKVSSHLRDELVSTLTAKAQGMFRWVELSIETLSNSRRMSVEKDVRSELGKLPLELKKQYAIIYGDILDSAPFTASIARKVFSWILGAQRALTTEELIAAVALDDDGSYHKDLDTSQLLYICRNLIMETSVDNNSMKKSFQLAHLSVKEFLEELPEYSCERINTVAVSRCLDNFNSNPCLNETFASTGTTYRQLLRDYSIYLFEHAERSNLTRPDSTMARKMTDFLVNHQYQPTAMLEEWVGLVDNLLEHYVLPQDTKDLSLFERKQRTYHQIFRGDNRRRVDRLVYEYGLLSVLKVLDDDNKMAWRSQFIEKSSILHDLIRYGQCAIIEFLLEIKLPDLAPIRELGNCLRNAVYHGQEDITALLLELGANPFWNYEKGFWFTPLGEVFETESFDILKQLVEKAELIQEEESNKQTWKSDLLTEALSVGWDAAIKYLIERDTTILYTSCDQDYRTNLQLAVSKSQRTVIKVLLDRCLQNGPETGTGCYLNCEAYVNAVDADNRTALHYLMDRDYSVYRESEDIMKMLVDYGANLTAICNDGVTVLHVAASIGSTDMVHLLAEKGSDIKAMTFAGANALHLAAGGPSSSPSIIRYLTGKEIDPLARDPNGRTPLHYAAAACNIHMIRSLLHILLGVNDLTQYVATELRLGHLDTQSPCTASQETNRVKELINVVDNEGKSMLHVVGSKYCRPIFYGIHYHSHRNEKVHEDVKDTVRLLLDLGADINKTSNKGMIPLCFQIYRYLNVDAINFAVANELLAHGADPNLPDDYGRAPLYHAVLHSACDTIERLLRAGANVDAVNHDRETPLHMSSKRESLSSATGRLLLFANADYEARDCRGATPLHHAARGNYWMVQMLVKKGANVHSRDHSGATPLHSAAMYGDSRVIEALLKYGSDLNAVTQSEETPLHLAAINGNSNAIEDLLKYGSDVKAVTQSEETPLHLAAINGNSNAIEDLLKYGSDVKAVTRSGETPLHFAAMHRNPAAIKALLESGSDLNAITQSEETPLHLAAMYGSSRVIEALLRSGSDPEAVDIDGANALQYVAKYAPVFNEIELLDDEIPPYNFNEIGIQDLEIWRYSELSRYKGYFDTFRKLCEASGEKK